MVISTELLEGAGFTTRVTTPVTAPPLFGVAVMTVVAAVAVETAFATPVFGSMVATVGSEEDQVTSVRGRAVLLS